MTTIDEYDLNRRAMCPLLQATPSKEEALMRRFVRTTLNRTWVEAEKREETTDRFDRLFAEAWPGEEPMSPKHLPLIRRAGKVATFLQLLRAEFKIDPPRPYQLALGQDVKVTGTYFGLQRRVKGVLPPMILVDVPRRPTGKSTYLNPEALGLVRLAAAFRLNTLRSTKIGLFYLPLRYGKPWERTTVNLSLARTWVDHILEDVRRNRVFPQSGAHCLLCTQHSCRSLFEEEEQPYV